MIVLCHICVDTHYDIWHAVLIPKLKYKNQDGEPRGDCDVISSILVTIFMLYNCLEKDQPKMCMAVFVAVINYRIQVTSAYLVAA